MFILYAEKTRLSVQKSEPVTSGSVNVYPVRFQFSPDWDGMVPTAVFRADWKTYAVVLDQNGECVIPWEALAKPRCRLEAGVYGARDGNVVLPTIWADLGTVLEGAGPGEPARPPTAGVLEQVMGELAAVRQLVAALKAPDHGLLPGRDAADQHPIQAVAGLEDALARVPSAMTAQELEDILKGSGEEPLRRRARSWAEPPPPPCGGGLGRLWTASRTAANKRQPRTERWPRCWRTCSAVPARTASRTAGRLPPHRRPRRCWTRCSARPGSRRGAGQSPRPSTTFDENREETTWHTTWKN